MKKSELQFDYPESLVALEPGRPSRVLRAERDTRLFSELHWEKFLASFTDQDVLVRNDTKVIKRRLFSKTPGGVAFEILFVSPDALDPRCWQVLCPASRWKDGEVMRLPVPGVTAQLVARGRVQRVRLSRALTDQDFADWGEAPLPPYVQKARGERHTRPGDEGWYQTPWAKHPGSTAAPTASLHFTDADFEQLRARGVTVLDITLHVGLGTYLPVLAENLTEHPMHAETVEIRRAVWDEILSARAAHRRVWALGTTVTRALESAALGKLAVLANGDRFGETDLLILPGFKFQLVDRLMTNFHQPESTLLALVMAFADVELVRAAYAWAVARRFRLFSYGDLTLWI